MSRGARLEKRTEWSERLRRFARSKLSVAEFCRREKVSVPSYYHWRHKLAGATSELDVGSEPATFIPVQVTSPTGLEVTFPNGARLTLPAQSRQQVQDFIQSIAIARTTQGGA
jgi:hypothetical protein